MTIIHLLSQFDNGEIFPNLSIYSELESKNLPDCLLEKPFLSWVIQGQTTAQSATQDFVTQANQLALLSSDMPLTIQVRPPYSAVILTLDFIEIADFIQQYDVPIPDYHNAETLAIFNITTEIRTCFERLINLLNRPKDLQVLAPLIRQELYYWLLQQPKSAMLYHSAVGNGHCRRIRQATEWLRSHFAEPLSVPELAKQVQMSKSNFYAQFRTITGISPL